MEVGVYFVDGLFEGLGHVRLATDGGRGDFADVEEDVGFGAGGTPEFLHPCLVGAGEWEGVCDFWVYGGGVELAVRSQVSQYLGYACADRMG